MKLIYFATRNCGISEAVGFELGMKNFYSGDLDGFPMQPSKNPCHKTVSRLSDYQIFEEEIRVL